MSDLSASLVTAAQLIVDGNASLLAIVGRSLAVSALAVVIGGAVGLVLGAWLGVARYPGRPAVLVVLNSLLAVPSVVVGLIVYLMLSRTGPLGFLGWLFSFQAMVVAQSLLVLPVVTALTRQVVESAETTHGEQWHSLGAGTLARSVLLAFDERHALFMVFVTAFSRAITEVGAVMIVGGNIDGFTRVMTTAIALETSKGDLPLALALGFVLLVVMLALHGLAAFVQYARSRMDTGLQENRIRADPPVASRHPPYFAGENKGHALFAPTAVGEMPEGQRGRVLSLESASVKFGAQTALASCSLSIAKGERIALLGANGSGKSTLLRLLHGQQMPASGERVSQTEARQVMVFQQPHMLRLSALLNVTLALWFSGKSWNISRVDALQALSSMGFENIMHRNARAMSVGQRQRLALVRAWTLAPDILFLDEPTASLDPKARRDVEALIQRFADNGCTLVFASHNLGQAKRLATRVIYLEQGKLLVDLPTKEFFNKELPNEAALFLQGERV